MSHSREKLCISEAEHVFCCRGKDLSVLAMLTSTALKEKKEKKKYIKNGCCMENTLEVEKSFYPSCVVFAVFWLLLCKEKDLLPVRCSLLPLVRILQSLLRTFSLWREILSSLHCIGLPCFAPVTPLSHQRDNRKREIDKTCPF